jgi:hypothetical protein
VPGGTQRAIAGKKPAVNTSEQPWTELLGPDTGYPAGIQTISILLISKEEMQMGFLFFH